MEALLKNRVAIVYGAGPIGAAVATSFANEGARVWLAALSDKRTKPLAEKIRANGGNVDTAIVDVLNKSELDNFVDRVFREEGRLDISFCATSYRGGGGEQGQALSEINYDTFILPTNHFLQSQFLTTQAASRQMMKQGSGVLMMITAIPSRMAIPYTTGFGPAWAAMQALSLTLAAELGQYGIRTVCLHSAGSPESQESIDQSFSKSPEAEARAKNWKFIHRNLLNKWPTLAQVGNMAAFMASDKAGVTTGTLINITGGMTDI